jgi:hypothetical protein
MITKIFEGEWGVWPQLAMTALVICTAVGVAFW